MSMSAGMSFIALLATAAGCRAENERLPVNPARFDASAGAGGRGGGGGTGGSVGTGGSMAGTGGNTAFDGNVADASASDADGSALDASADAASDGPLADAAADRAPDRMPDGPPPRNQPEGAACDAGAECRSTFCVDGFCCNGACNDPCQSCRNTSTGLPNGRCGANTAKQGMRCGTGCQGIAGGVPSVVPRFCDTQGRCIIPPIPSNGFEPCADDDPCTTMNCAEDARTFSARCVKLGCAADSCCCVMGTTRMCTRTQMCNGQGRACAP
jgi:hypothetical protein